VVHEGDLDAARGGDPEALEALITAQYDRVHALCRRMLGNEADALDATQDAMVAAIRALDRFDGRSSFGTWLYRIATNSCIDELRRRRRRPRPLPGLLEGHGSEGGASVGGGGGGGGGGVGRGVGGGVGGAGPGADLDPADAVSARMDVDVALRRLPIEFRTAVVLRDVCDLPYDEIAAILDVPVGTVRSRIARGRASLAAMWGSETAGQNGPAGEVAAGNSAAGPVVRTSKDRAPASREALSCEPAEQEERSE